jgi:hypothetical protein
VFENLLATYNPETGKQDIGGFAISGSTKTPVFFPTI